MTSLVWQMLVTKSGNTIETFRVLTAEMNRHDIPWKKTFISKSVEYQRDVVPIHFGGQNSERFYRIARFSDKHLPFNLAMMFLVDEMYKNVGKHFRIAIGKPIPWQTFDKSKTATEWAQYVEDKVYEL